AFTANRSALHPHPRVPHSAPQLSFSCSGASQETHSRCPDAPDAQSVPDAQSALRAARWPDVVRRSCVRASTKAGLRLGAARERRTGSTWGSSRRFRLRSQLPWSQLPWSQLPWSQLPRARREMHPPPAGAPDRPARTPSLACRRRCGYVRRSLVPEEPPMNLNLVAHATRSSLDQLYEVLDGASGSPAECRFDLLTRTTKLYRQLGVGEFLLEGDAQDLYAFLQLGVQACDDLLREVSPEDVATSRLLAWFDAVCVGDRDAMASIAARAPRECNPRKEYEEDFLYMRIAMDAVGLGRPVAEVEPMLARLRELSADRRDARAELLVAFLGGDVSAFVAALRALCEEHDAFYGEIVPSSLVEERRILRHLPPLEVVAWLALARRSTMPDAELAEVPAALLEECAVPRPP